MPSLLDELYDSVLEYLSKDETLLGSPKIKRKLRDDYGILSGNFFFKETVDIHLGLLGVVETMENTIKSHIGSQGEILKSILQKGEIWDGGKKYFEIKAGSILEAYCFNCRSLTFARTTWERQLFDAQKEWLSIDVDHVQNTLWFEEP